MPRSTSEWIGLSDDHRAPGSVRCAAHGCQSRIKGHGYCNKHLIRLRKYGDVERTAVSVSSIPRRSRGAELSLSYIEDRSVPEPNTGCWIWLLASQPKGYGVVRVGGRTIPAHRLAYNLCNVIPIPSCMDACHKCDTPSCVNPAHIFPGTRQDNMRDCSQKGRAIVPSLQGAQSPNARLTEADVVAIRQDGRSQRAIARAYGVDKGTIAHIIKRTTWRHT